MSDGPSIIDSKDIPDVPVTPQKKTPIIEVDYGIAWRTGNGKIYINKDLKKYDSALYKKILAHEHDHHNGPYSTQDLEEDLSIDYFPLSKKIDFCIKYPKGLWAFSPVIITEDEIAVSWLHIFEIVVFILLVGFILKYALNI